MSMELTEEERGWALAIKKALLEKQEDDDPSSSWAKSVKLSDMEIAHHAIIAKDKIDKALKRIRRLQVFKEEHGIPMNDSSITAEQAMDAIRKFEQKSPGMFLSFGSHNGRYVSTWDYSSFLPANYTDPEDWKNCFAAFYYLFDAMNPDIASIREGVAMLMDSKDLGWKNFSLEMEKHAAHLYQDAYPIRIKEMSVIHAPVILKAMYALCKPFLSKKIKEVFDMDAKVEDIQSRYPTEILATTMGGTQSTMDMEEKMLQALKLRYENLSKFTL